MVLTIIGPGLNPLISNMMLLRTKLDACTYIKPAFNVELDLSARAASPSRSAVNAEIGDVMTTVRKRPKKVRK